MPNVMDETINLSAEKASIAEQLAHEWRYVSAAALSVCISLIWIWAVARFGYKPDNAGRGGAIGVALSFLMLFGRRNYAKIVSATHTEVKLLREQISSLAQQHAKRDTDLAATDAIKLIERESAATEAIELIESESAATQGSQAFLNIVLSVSSVIGTLAWGFGDLAVELMRNYHFLGC